MENKEIFNIIDRIVNPETERSLFTANEALAAVFYGGYYIRPGKDTEKYLIKIGEIMKKYLGKVQKMYNSKKKGIPYEEWLWGKIATQAVFVARECFDKEFYEETIDCIDFDKEFDFVNFKAYMNSLDEVSAEMIFAFIDFFACEFDVLISDANYKLMWEEIESELKKGAFVCLNNCAGTRDDLRDSQKLLVNQIGKKKMIDILFKYIESSSVVLNYIEKIFKYVPLEEAYSYTRLALLTQEAFNINVFDPIITDLTNISLKSIDVSGAKKVCGKGGRTFMMGAVNANRN